MNGQSEATETATAPSSGARMATAWTWTMAVQVAAVVALAWIGWSSQAGELAGLFAIGLAAIALAALIFDLRHRRARLVATLQSGATSAANIAAGDLVTRIDPVLMKDDALLQSLEATRTRLFEVVGAVRAGTTKLAGSSSHLARDSDIIAEQSKAQSAALQSTAQALEELTTAVKNNAEHSQRANDRVRTAALLAEKGGSAVLDAVTKVGGIRDSSRKIVDIIGVINGIAFQTNILALNASVEAARAGEHGRGFAVVADEVRSLAQRAATAAREIETLIKSSVAEVEGGHAVVQGIGRSMQQIVEAFQDVAEDIGGISAATQQQSAGIEHVNDVMDELDSTVRRNLQVIEETKETVASVNAQAVSLLKAVSIFKLGDREHGTPEEAKQLVERGIEYGKTHGKQKLIDEINKMSKGSLIDRDLYLMIITLDGAIIKASGMSTRVIGLGGPSSVDVEGKQFIVEMAAIAKRSGTGWVEYKWNHPITNEVDTKATYVARFEDVLVGCGAYKR